MEEKENQKLQEEIKQLKDRNERLTFEREILKKQLTELDIYRQFLKESSIIVESFGDNKSKISIRMELQLNDNNNYLVYKIIQMVADVVVR